MEALLRVSQLLQKANSRDLKNHEQVASKMVRVCKQRF